MLQLPLQSNYLDAMVTVWLHLMMQKQCHSCYYCCCILNFQLHWLHHDLSDFSNCLLLTSIHIYHHTTCILGAVHLHFSTSCVSSVSIILEKIGYHTNIQFLSDYHFSCMYLSLLDYTKHYFVDLLDYSCLLRGLDLESKVNLLLHYCTYFHFHVCSYKVIIHVAIIYSIYLDEEDYYSHSVQFIVLISYIDFWMILKHLQSHLSHFSLNLFEVNF